MLSGHGQVGGTPKSIAISPEASQTVALQADILVRSWRCISKLQLGGRVPLSRFKSKSLPVRQDEARQNRRNAVLASCFKDSCKAVQTIMHLGSREQGMRAPPARPHIS